MKKIVAITLESLQSLIQGVAIIYIYIYIYYCNKQFTVLNIYIDYYFTNFITIYCK